MKPFITASDPAFLLLYSLNKDKLPVFYPILC